MFSESHAALQNPVELTPAAQKLIVALDVPAAQAALVLADHLRGQTGVFKVGLELFSSQGPALVRELLAREARVFLDLKLHDIPNTVRGAAREVARLGVSMITVHASGGRTMMQAALEGVRAGASAGRAPLVLGVTALTSLTDQDLADVGWREPAEAVVLRLASLAQAAGLDGVVASPQEAASIRRNCGPAFAIVTPGIRPAAASRDDQARASTPEAAIRAGADFLVVGRPITQASDPAAAAGAIVREIELALRTPNHEPNHEPNQEPESGAKSGGHPA
ncbi:MAG TPA: orotidine-5'-phosphate decarboxylase [Terriglobia bacterium]|jgi:orotidine-5'-phosphate decarboxylase|nr:orotidine-5'-phosphate decarboxylase [Terriglobia bacterium]